MPVSEESVGSVVGVPIKKRKYKFVQWPSPPQISSLLPREQDLPQKEMSISELETPISAIEVASNGYSFVDRRSFTDRNVNLSSENSVGLSLQHSDVTCTSISDAEVGCKGKLTPEDDSTFQQDAFNSRLLFSQKEPLQQRLGEEMSEVKPIISSKSVFRRVSGNTELFSALKEPCQQPIGEEMSEAKPIISSKSGFRRVSRNTELLSAVKEPLQQPIGEEMTEVKPTISCKSAFRSVSGNTELLSALKEPLGLPFKGQNIQGSCPEHEELYQASVESFFDIYHGKLKDLTSSQEQVNGQTKDNHIKSKVDCTHFHENRSHWDLNNTSKLKDLTLSQEQVNVQTKGNHIKSKVDCTHLHENRSHWDLNTTMDTWEDSLSLSVNHAADGMNGLDQSQIIDLKHAACSKELVLREPEDSHVTFAKRVHVESGDNKQSLDFLSCFNQETGCPSTKLTVVKLGSDQSTSERLMPPGNMKFVKHKPLKSDHFEWGYKGDIRTVASRNQSIYLRTPKPEVSDGISQEGLQTVGRNKLVNCRGIKFEPVEESGEVGLKARVGISHLPETHKLNPELPVSGEVAQGASETVVKALDLVPESVLPDATEAVVADDMLDAAQMACSEVSNQTCSAFISSDAILFDSSAISGAAESGDGGDDDKINISADIHEDDPYDSDHDASPNVDTVVRHTNDNDNNGNFEDGEVREPLVHGTSVEGTCVDGHVSCVDLDNKEVDGSGDPGDGVMKSPHLKSADCKTENSGEAVIVPCTEGHGSALCIEKKEQSSSTVPHSKKSSASAVSTAASGKKSSIKAIRRTPRGCSGKKEHGLKGLETNSDQVVGASTSHETVIDDGKGKTVSNPDSVKGSTDQGKVNYSKNFKTGPPVKVDEFTGANCSRIINLTRAGNGLSAGRMRSNPMELQTERGRFPRTSFRVDELHPRGSRDESCMDGHRKFERDGNIDRLPGNFGPDFMHMKRRVDNNSDTLRCDRDFASRHYSSLTGARFPRPKNIAAVASAELECNGLVIAPDGCVVNSGNARRKPINDELESFCHPPFRRRSPGEREIPMPLGSRMVRRPPRVISPDRFICRGDPDMVVVRREEKFVRDLPDAMMDPSLSSCSRPQYQHARKYFIRRERSFSPIQGRGSVCVACFSSKSPPRSRTRSPCSRPSPRRSPDQFDGHSELLLHRSPQVFRGEIIGSPHRRPCFADSMMVRRHGSPPHILHLSDEMINMGPLREHSHSRPFILNRSPSRRILQRSTRRIDMIDSQERVEGDECFGPLHPGRFHELVVDDCVNERQKSRERCGPIRSFRRHEVDVDIERFRYHENGSRPYGFCSRADEEFEERGSPRDFEARVNQRLGNPRRPRSIEREHNERFGDQEWVEASFKEAVRLKRGRFQ